MRAQYIFVVLILVLPSHLTGITITTTSNPKEERKPPNIIRKEELTPASTNRINITERQRRLIPYMTFYLSRNYNRPSNHLQDLREPQPPPPPQYRLVPQKITVQPFHGKIILVNQVNPQKYGESAPILYQPKVRYNPFSENNKLPGGFTPMRSPHQQNHPIRVQVLNASPTAQDVRPVQDSRPVQDLRPVQDFRPIQDVRQSVQYVSSEQHQVQGQIHPQQLVVSKEPDYSAIFDKLLQLKQLQYTKAPSYETVPQYQKQKVNVVTQYHTRNYATPSPTKYVTTESYQPETYKTIPPSKTYIHTYTPSDIDISNENKVKNYENFESLKTYNQIPAPAPAKEYELVPIKEVQVDQQIVPVKNVQIEPLVPLKNVQIDQNDQDYEIRTNQHVSSQEQKNYEPVVIHRPTYQSVPVRTYRPVYQPAEPTIAVENPHSLSVILKQLQETNTLPQTLTPDNIDNSIKTLVQILNALKHTEKFQRPIVVTQAEDSSDSHSEDNIDEYDDGILPETISQSFPGNTPEGGTPGKPGVDYPAYALIPQTSFNCKKQRYKGFFGDPDTNCQVWHYCDLNGGQASFLCPNGTIFSQVALTCDWWYNVKCATTTQLYVLNERLYKYILPFTPKFPEDYSGPLVDRYLALKFQEMEEKMKKQKKGKPEKSAEDVQDSEVNKLEDIQQEDEEETAAESQEHTTIISKASQ